MLTLIRMRNFIQKIKYVQMSSTNIGLSTLKNKIEKIRGVGILIINLIG